MTTVLLVWLVSLPTTSCYVYHVYQVGGPGCVEDTATGRPVGPNCRELGNQPSTEWRHRTLHGAFFGAIRQDLPIVNCREPGSHGVEEVKVERTLGQILLSVVTIGVWVPQRFSWRCYRAPPATGTLP